MKKRQILSVTLAFLNPVFSEEAERNSQPFDSTVAEHRSDISSHRKKKTSSKEQSQKLSPSAPSAVSNNQEESKSSNNQNLLTQKQAELDRKEKSLSDQEKAQHVKEGQLTKQKQSLLDQMEEIAAQEEELLTKEQLLLDRERRGREREERLAKREQGGDDDQQYSSTTNSNETSTTPTCDTYHRMHVGLRHTEARGVGYKDGYTTLEAFGIYDRNRYFMPFLDIRGHVFDNGKLAGTAGIGVRSYLSSLNHLLGYYCYYDVRQENHHLTAQQVSPGIELLGNRMEYRANGYFAVGEDESHKYHFKFGKFEGHHILLKAKQKHVLSGGDAEIGAHLTQSIKYDVYLGAGPYYFCSSGASSWGGKARLLGRYKEYISLEASYSYDHLFRSVVQGTVALNLPFGCRLKRKEKDCTPRINLALSRAAFSPYRFEIPVIKKVSRKETAINPATDAPWRVWFVNNTSSSNGSFESPFPTLIQAQTASAPNDMIYVFPGDGTTNGMNAGMVLQNGQKFFGSGIAHKISTTNGKITIPAFSQAFPSITNINLVPLTGNVLIPANGNEISGFNLILTLANNSAIFSPVAIRGITIDHNNFSAASPIHFNGIALTGSGKMIITNNQFSGGGGLFRAIALTTSDGMEITGKASNNIISNYEFGFGMSLTNNASANFEVSNNTISNCSAQGILWVTGSGNPLSSQVLISGNSIIMDGAFGILVGLNNAINTNTTISNNTISAFTTQGIIVTAVAPNAITEIIGNTVTNNIGGSGSNGIAFTISQGFNAGNLLVSNNNVATTTSSAQTSGILAQITSSGTSFSSNIANNQVTIAAGTGTPENGINVNCASGSVICTGLSNNQVIIEQPGATGINIFTTGTGVINIDNFSGNVSPENSFSGNVNEVAPGTCGNP